MDNTDKIIIEELKKNSKITMKELGKKVHLSGQAASTRVMKLEDLAHNLYLKFIDTQQDYILHNYKISGDGCYLLECNFPSNEKMDEFLVSLSEIVNYKVNIILKDTTESSID